MSDSILSVNVRWDGAWFRVFGYGAAVRIKGTYKPLFSERNRLEPRVDLGPLRFVFLRPAFPR